MDRENEQARDFRESKDEHEKTRFLAQQLVRQLQRGHTSALTVTVGPYEVAIRRTDKGANPKYVLRGIYNVAAGQRSVAMAALRDIQKAKNLEEAVLLAQDAMDACTKVQHPEG